MHKTDPTQQYSNIKNKSIIAFELQSLSRQDKIQKTVSYNESDFFSRVHIIIISKQGWSTWFGNNGKSYGSTWFFASRQNGRPRKAAPVKTASARRLLASSERCTEVGRHTASSTATARPARPRNIYYLQRAGSVQGAATSTDAANQRRYRGEWCATPRPS